MSYIPYNEGIYKEKYLKENDKQFVNGFLFAVEQLEGFDLEQDTGIEAIDAIITDVSKEVVERIGEILRCTAREVVVSSIDSYDNDYLEKCYKQEEEETA